MKRRIVVVGAAQGAEQQLNELPIELIEIVKGLGFQEVGTFSGLYIILDNKDIIFYDDNSATFGRIVGGELGDRGQTFLGYVNEKDGWEIFLEDYSALDVQYHSSLGEVFEASGIG